MGRLPHIGQMNMRAGGREELHSNIAFPLGGGVRSGMPLPSPSGKGAPQGQMRK